MATENGMILAQKIDEYVELASKLDDKISDLEFQIEQLKKQLTEKDILLDIKISKLNQIRYLLDKI